MADAALVRDLGDCRAALTAAEYRAQMAERDLDARGRRSWDDAQVMAILSQRQAAMAALAEVIQHCLPNAGPEVCRAADPVWQRAGAVLWGVSGG